jgi:hypothetical protein
LRLTPPLNLPAPGRRQTLYVVFFTLQSPVFLVNSRLGPFTATPSGSGREVPHPTGAPLLPKLRGYFAEFLSGRSLTRLGIFSPSTCVGLRYGQPRGSLEVFLGSVESTSWFGRGRTSWLPSVLMTPRIFLGDPPTSPPGISSRPYAYPSASPHRNNVPRLVQEC